MEQIAKSTGPLGGSPKRSAALGSLGRQDGFMEYTPSSEVSADDFEELVGEALDTIPPALARAMRNVVVMVEAEAPGGEVGLLGLYEGIPLTQRDSWYAGVLPDRITIFRGPILRRCSTRAEVVEEVRITVVHEVAHHFGIDDDALDDLGYA